MAMSLREYVTFRCQQMLRAERDILVMNNQLAGEVQHPRLKEQFQQHSRTTEQQIRNLEQIVERLDSEQREGGGGILGQVTEALGMSGEWGGTPLTRAMMDEHRMFMDRNPAQHLIDLHDALEGDKVEHIEMATYQPLIRLAHQLGEGEIAAMLQQNLDGEQNMCAGLEGIFPMLMQEFGSEGRRAA